MTLKLTINDRPRALQTAEILQTQWRERLGIMISIASVNEAMWAQNVADKRYDGMIEDAWSASYVDPNEFLAPLAARATGTTWHSDVFDDALNAANAVPNPLDRLDRLADVERILMKAMPVIPLYFDTFSFLQKPFVRGLWTNPGDAALFKYVSIDTNWRPA